MDRLVIVYGDEEVAAIPLAQDSITIEGLKRSNASNAGSMAAEPPLVLTQQDGRWYAASGRWNEPRNRPLRNGERIDLGAVGLKLRRETRPTEAKPGPTDRTEVFTGISEALAGIKDQVRTYAPLTAPVLISGETGTGKELVAKALHEMGRSAAGPFMVANCGAIPETLAEAEFFGYRRGAFTGAVDSQAGLCEQADNGTLFLDEVGELPLSLQAKLLRFLEDGVVRRIGGDKATRVSTRIIAASNRPLESMVAAGRFRLDLLHRLKVLHIRTTPIRERVEDIPLLALHFLVQFAPELGQKSLSDTALSTIQAHDWPGNVRELKHALYRAAVHAKRDTIHAADLDLERPRISLFNASLGIQRTRPDPDRILEIYSECKGNISATARKLGLPRTTVRDMLRKRDEYGQPALSLSRTSAAG